MFGVRRAITCVVEMHRNRTYRGEQIGVMLRDVNGLNHYMEGEVVIFKLHDNPKECVVEKPHTIEKIEENRAKGSLICSAGCTVGFPASYIRPLSIITWWACHLGRKTVNENIPISEEEVGGLIESAIDQGVAL